MPIRGLTDRGMSFPEIGRIRKGGPKVSPTEPGPDLTYFRVEFDKAEVEAAQRFVAEFGEQPEEIDVMLPFNTVDENFEAWREAYLAGGLVHRCEGPDPDTGEPGRVFLAFDPSNGTKLASSPRDGVLCDGKSRVATYTKQNGEQGELFCKPAGRLRVLVPALRRLAFLTLVTGSIWDLNNISRQIRLLLETSGRLVGIPLILRRRMAEVSQPRAGGKRVRGMKSLCSLEADPRWVDAKIAALLSEATPTVDGHVLRLEAGLGVLDEPETEEEDEAAWPAEEAAMRPPPVSSPPAAKPATPSLKPAPVLERTSAAPPPSERPYPPETLIERIKAWTATAVSQKLNVPPTARKALKRSFEMMLLGDAMYEATISAIMFELFGVPLIADLSGPSVHTLLSWLRPDPVTGTPSEIAKQEALQMADYLRSIGKL